VFKPRMGLSILVHPGFVAKFWFVKTTLAVDPEPGEPRTVTLTSRHGVFRAKLTGIGKGHLVYAAVVSDDETQSPKTG